MTKLSERLSKLYLEGSKTMAWIEANGIKIDTDALERHDAETTTAIKEGEDALRDDPVYATWRRRFGTKTNLQSHEQLGEVVYRDLGYQVEYRTKTGRASTNEATLSRIDLPFVKRYFEVAKLRKLKGTYFAQLRRETVNGFLHPFFDLFAAVSGRSGSSAPNFQNVPIRNPKIGKIIRSCFVSRKEDWRLVEIDFKGIEVAISACINRDPTLIAYVSDPSTDMHRDMAMQLFLLDAFDAAKKPIRHSSKNGYVFPSFYGSCYFQTAPALWRMSRDIPYGSGTLQDHLKSRGFVKLGECDVEKEPQPGTYEYHVREIDRDFWGSRFRVFGQWRKDEYARYLRNGYFESPVGMRWEGVYKRNDVLNYSTQQSAFACLLNTANRARKWIRSSGMESLMVGQIHDSMVFDAPESEIQKLLTGVTRVVEEDLPMEWNWICVPLTAEVEVCPPGGSWVEKQPWEKKDGVWGPRS